MEDSQHEDGKFIASVPKAELHIHIEGTIGPDLLFRMADRNEINLPYKTPEDVLKLQILKKADSTENLTNFLECLDISRNVLCQAEDYYDMAINFLRKCRDENIVYSEVMFDPQQGMRQGVIFEECVEALMQAQKEGLTTYGVETQWIMCFQRDHSAHEAMGILSLADSYREFIVGVGLDNAEINGFPDLFKDVFQKARSQGYHLTSHCDVNQPNTISHIHGCIEILGVNRIDHGLNIALDKALTETVISRDISLTGCPTFYISENSCPPERMDMIKKLGTSSNYLIEPHTAKRCRSEFFIPDLNIRTIHSKWLEMEPRQMDLRASKLLEKRLLAYEKPDIDSSVEKDLIKYVENKK